jgi:nucleoside-diphosphate-sugar epimerase
MGKKEENIIRLNMTFSKKILVTGGKGFVGTHLVKLLKQKFDVFSLDRTDSLYKDNLSDFICDLTNYKEVENTLKDQKFDVVIHCATLPLVESIINPKKCYEGIVKMISNLVECQRKGYFNKLLNISTSEVYGNSFDGSFLNEKSHQNPMTTYASAKLSCDYLIKSFANCYDLKYTILRPFNQYGIGKKVLNKGGIIQQTIKSLVYDKPLILFHEGKTFRDYVYVKDTCKVIEEIVTKDLFVNDEFVLASGQTRSMISIVEKIENILNLKVKKKLITEGREGDVLKLCGDASKLHNLLGHNIKHDFESNFTETIKGIWKNCELEWKKD